MENFYLKVPNDVKDFWSVSESAVLFKDVDYGQWGLEILSPEKAMLRSNVEKERRSTDYYDTDLVIGSFLGDSDLLIISCDENSKNYGTVLISLPLDRRSDWPVVGESFLAFLEKYAFSEGDKFWEPSL